MDATATRSELKRPNIGLHMESLWMDLVRWILRVGFQPYHFTPSERASKPPPPVVPGSIQHYLHKFLRWKYFGNAMQRRRALLYTQATLAIYGNVFMWVGMWQVRSRRLLSCCSSLGFHVFYLGRWAC
jgi:hypothetical protein